MDEDHMKTTVDNDKKYNDNDNHDDSVDDDYCE